MVTVRYRVKSLMATELPLNQVIHGDCLEVLPDFPEESVDLVFADPPYNLQLHQDLWRPNQTKVEAVDEDWDQFASFKAYDEFTRAWMRACQRVLKASGTLWVIGTYHNIHRVGAILQDLGFWILNSIIWVKANPMPNFRGVRFTNAHETLIWAQKERGATYTFNHHAMKAINGDLQMRSDWYLPLCSGKERLRVDGQRAHPTQKPEALLYRVVLSSSDPGDVVLDPFIGTGTTGVVAKRLHRQWVGIEREADYVELARQRIAAVEPDADDHQIYSTPEPRKQPRIPFGTLLEHRLLRPGQQLFLGRDEKLNASVRADGALEYNGQRGSIHQLARQIRGAPCNGWEQWYYLEAERGELRPIDHLRQELRAQLHEE
jgi:site-specific DNA-methyltransferase (adenine-specific)